jgi:hypothetical protein
MLLKTDGKCDAGQNSDYSAGYSIGSLQGRKQRKLSQNTETISEL